MKAITKGIAAAAIVAATMSACSNDDFVATSGEGTVYLSACVNSDVKVKSRADIDDYADNLTIWLANDKGVVRQYHSLGEVPAAGVQLLTGSYKALAWVGDSVPASFDSKYFRGAQDFTIENGDKKSVEIACKIVNSVVTVNYDASVDEVLSNYTFTVGHSQGELTFEGRTDARGYFMMNSRDKNLDWTLTGTKNDGSTYTRTGVIENCAEATLYTVNITCSGDNLEEIGGAYLTVSIDETMIDVEDEIVVTAAPEVTGYGFNLAETVRGESGTIGRKSLWITTSAPLEGLIVDCPYFEALFGLDGSDFNLMSMTDQTLKDKIIAGGINYVLTEDGDFSTVKLNFESELLDKLPDGTYAITVTAIDKAGKRGTGVLSLAISAAPVSILAVNPADVWSSTAVLNGEIIKADASNPCIKYRKQGTSAWTVADNTAAAGLSASLTGLEPGTVYEYCAATDDFETEVMTFTTEAAAQLPNAGFEEWQSLDTAPAIIGDRSFWDSGNHGSATLHKNVTVPDESIKHSGNYSIKLESKFPSVVGIGKFAAGNVFAGRYLDTNGTDGELGWGRPFASRPKALKGYVKYTSVEVNCIGNKKDTPQGYQDQGIIYIAILDGSTQDFTTTKSKDRYTEFPVIIQTKSEQLFNKTKPNVLGYGEQIFDTTSGDGMIEFEIPVEYFNTGVKAGHIMVVASSSKQGDYFIGGEGATMWVDDLELVY